jgi:hypothetical protein
MSADWQVAAWPLRDHFFLVDDEYGYFDLVRRDGSVDVDTNPIIDTVIEGMGAGQALFELRQRGLLPKDAAITAGELRAMLAKVSDETIVSVGICDDDANVAGGIFADAEEILVTGGKDARVQVTAWARLPRTWCDITSEEADFSVEMMPSDTPIKGSFAYGNAEDDAAAEADVRKQLNEGNQWAWCDVVVTARWKGFEGTTTLCACSYVSEERFREIDLPSLKSEALEALNERVAAAKKAIDAL